jgi:hypothetical protein
MLSALLEYLDGGRSGALDCRAVHDHALGPIDGRDVVHHVHHEGLDDGPQAAGSGISRYGLVGYGLDRSFVEDELDLVDTHRLLVLAQDRVLGLGDDALQVVAW